MTQATSSSQHQDRIDELEIKAAFQEQLISDLNDELVRHANRITDLELHLNRVIENLKNPAEDSPQGDEPPPHY